MLKDLLKKQINEAPDLLRCYIHDLETSKGEVAHMIQDLYQLKENLKILERKGDTNGLKESYTL